MAERDTRDPDRPRVPTTSRPARGTGGPEVLDDERRTRLLQRRRKGGVRAVWAGVLLSRDDHRRRNRGVHEQAALADQFDRPVLRLTDNGYAGPTGGRVSAVGRPAEWRGTTAQVVGLWPWSVGAGAPLVGTPLGPHLRTGAPVCFDPMNWFLRGGFITAPSLFVLGLNGFGKSSLVRRIVLGGIAQGITPLILADVKPDYRALVELVGGQVIDLGYGYGQLNPLDSGVMGTVLAQLQGAGMFELARTLAQELRARQISLICALVELVRGQRVADFEETIIATALEYLYRPTTEGGRGFTHHTQPVLDDLLDVIVAGGPDLHLDAAAESAATYQTAVVPLRQSLRALTRGPFGQVFAGPTTVGIDLASTAVCIDVSHIPTGDRKLKAAVMLACWGAGFSAVEALNMLADAGLGPQRYFQVVMDELWQVLSLGEFMVERVDELTRLQRTIATALIMISHTIKDLQALGSDAAISRALGFLERARAKIFGALPGEEVSRLSAFIPFTATERGMVTNWSAPQALTGEAIRPGTPRPTPPGTGKFLLKVGEGRQPGIPFLVELTETERSTGIHDTNTRFADFDTAGETP
ncbi:hypothetical protein [Nocardia sp. CNY236]|uniref:hypothetical protein n=1 Tax=Nocardia sp. CNY236 TaxID=1169152 RepID=UPI001E436DE2|nr:hypothetical protein [Nocardia sp. CNY236]